MQINFKKTILFTGAGFTVNFGGFLAREMWSHIFNNPDLDTLPKIKELLRQNFDFEDVYSKVINDRSLPESEITKFQNIVIKSYEGLDFMVQNYNQTGDDPYGVNFHKVRQLLAGFAGSGSEKGATFTLNQDLFLERKCHSYPFGLAIPQHQDYFQQIQSGSIDTKKLISLPVHEQINEFKDKYLSSIGDHVYIKLHGSHGWISSDGKTRMILGTNKYADLMREPLLKWYFELFEEAIYRQDVRLFIIGYSFRDDHINECLLKAVEEYGLKIYILSPENPELLKKRLFGEPSQSGILWSQKNTKKIWDGVYGYFPYMLKDIFPSDQSETQVGKDLLRMFGNR